MILAAALAYISIPWRVLALRGKSPALLGRNWPRLATTDPEIVRSWWHQWPDANLGVVCGESFVALDVDPRHGGDDTLHDLEGRLGPLPDTPRYRTGGRDGGCRILLSHPGGLPVGTLGPGVEVKRGRQQIVMPPSIHPETGRRYEWEIGLDEAQLAPLPGAWLERMCSDRDAPSQKAATGDRNDVLLAIYASVYIPALTGRHPDHRGRVRCPFHKDGREKRPDLQIYGTNWSCYACPAPPGREALGGTIYTFAALLWGYLLPLRGPAFIHTRGRLLEALAAHVQRGAA